MTESERAALARENAALRVAIANAERVIDAVRTPRPETDANALAAVQARADSIAVQFGERASPPHYGESPLDYRRRQLSKFQRHSPRWAGMTLAAADGSVLDAIETQIFADAQTAAQAGTGTAPGLLFPIVRKDASGRQVTTYSGDPMAWMAPFMSDGVVGRVRRPGDDA